jgi:hypothetical protein
LEGEESSAEVEPTNRMAGLDNNIVPDRAGQTEAVEAARMEPTQIRGVRQAVRNIASSFEGLEFSTQDVRARMPGALASRVVVILSQLGINGELVKTGRGKWKCAKASKAAGAVAAGS